MGAGPAASIAPDGQVQWMKTIALTNFSDRFMSCWVEGVQIYAAGSAAVHSYPNSGRDFAYGLVAKLNLATGAFEGSLTFGDPSTSSGFNAAIAGGDRIRCCGWTNRRGNTVESWFVELDLPQPFALAGAAPAAAVRAGTEGSGGLTASGRAGAR